MHKLIEMKDHLTHCAYEEITEHLDEADTGELGEVIDMIKDLEEAIYYATITKAMNAGRTETAWEESGSAKKRMDYMRSKEMHHDKSV
jgi:predicted house-cleaning noncanonical NTP pyrophosphatase (MazG superfamily)